MGTSQSREEHITDSETEEEDYEENEYADASADHHPSPSSSFGASRSVDDIDAMLNSLRFKHSFPPGNPNIRNPVKFYLHIGGNTPKAKWIVSEKLTSYKFIKTSKTSGVDYSDDDELDTGAGSWWVLRVASKVRARVSVDMQLKMFGDQRRVDFVDNAVWALKFFNDEDYRRFVTQFQDCLFENVYGLEATEENRIKVYGKEFIGWLKPEVADGSMWEDADDDKSPMSTPAKRSQELMEEFEEAANGGVQSLALGALDNSFLVNDLGVQVYRNFSRGIHGKGICVKFDADNWSVGQDPAHSAPKKALLMRAETNMMVMSPETGEASSHRA